MSRVARGAVYVMAVSLALAGVALRVVPATPPAVAAETPEPYTPPPAPTGVEQAATLLSFNQIVTGNLFAADRSAPEDRYLPPELAGAAEPDPPPRQETDRPAFRLRLFGTAVGPEGSVALIDADPGIPGAEVYRVGDRVQGARIIDILETAVLLDGPGGPMRLTLPDLRR